MNDFEMLQRIHEELKTVDRFPRFADSMIDFYEHLVERVPEDGFEQVLNDEEMTLEQETAVLQLQKYGYLDRTMHGIGHGRIEHHISLRSKRFHEIADAESKPLEPAWGSCKPHLMQDSGKREVFETGAVRDTAEGKPRPDLFSPFAMERIGLWLMRGAEKYSEHNWTKGIPASRCMASLHRHLMKYMQGATDEDHLSAVAANCMFLLHFEEVCKRGILPKNLLDLPKFEPMPRVHKNGDAVLEHELDEEFSWRKLHKDT